MHYLLFRYVLVLFHLKNMLFVLFCLNILNISDLVRGQNLGMVLNYLSYLIWIVDVSIQRTLNRLLSV